MVRSPAKLTKTLIDAAKPEATDYTIWDTEVQGLGLRVWPQGRKTFVCYHRTEDGTQRKPSLGVYGAITLPQARSLAQDMLGRVRAGQDPSRQRKESRAGATMAELCDRYLKEHAEIHKKPGSVRVDRTNIEKHVKPAIGTHKVATLSHSDIARLHRDMHEIPGAANRTVALLSKMLNLAEKWGLRTQGSNPTRHLTKYKERKLHRDLTELELARLARVLVRAETPHAPATLDDGDPVYDMSENPRAVAAIRLLIFTGCRRNEVLHLKWSEVELERNRLCLEDSKTGAKIIQLNSAAREVIEAQERVPGNPYVFPGIIEGQPVHDINRAWHRIRANAGLQDVRLHDLRHTFATYAAGAGHGLPVIGKLLGHKTQATTHRYADLASDPAQRASEDVGAAISKAMAGEPERAKPKAVI